MTDTTSTPAGERDVVDVLAADHEDFLTLVTEIQVADTPQLRRERADQLIAELVRHAVAEEMHVYPAMRDHLPDGDEAVEHDTEEHEQLEGLMKQIEGADAGEAVFLERVAQLERVLRDHIEDEESEQFPRLRQAIPRERMVQLADEVEKTKRIAPTRPHPAAPNAELFHKLVGPGVGMVDRMRDTLTGRNTHSSQG